MRSPGEGGGEGPWHLSSTSSIVIGCALTRVHNSLKGIEHEVGKAVHCPTRLTRWFNHIGDTHRVLLGFFLEHHLEKKKGGKSTMGLATRDAKGVSSLETVLIS